MRVQIFLFAFATTFLMTLINLTPIHGIIIDINPRQEKCLSDEVSPQSAMAISYGVVGEFVALTGVSLNIFDPESKLLLHKDDIDPKKDLHSFRFTSISEGRVRICFYNTEDAKRRVELILKSGVEAKDYAEVAKREHLKPVEIELRKLEDAVAEIHEDMLHMRDREHKLRDTNEETNSRVMWFSMFSIFILLAMGTWQIYYLRTFFKSKKLI